MEEVWKDIEGFEGLYQISNMGNVKNSSTGKIRSLNNEKDFYITVVLVDKEGNKKTVRPHRLVAKAFIGDIPKGYEVHHIDGNKQNNTVNNLQIVSKKEHKRLTMMQHPEFCDGMNHYNKFVKTRPIAQYDLEGNWVASYCNGSFASEFTGICQRNILQVATKTPFNNKGSVRKQAGGYIWKFIDEKGVV